MTAVRELLAAARSTLGGCVEDPLLDAQVLLAHAIERDRSWLYAWPEHTPTDEQLADFARLLAARTEGTPVAYLTGEREFWSLPLRINEGTLIPRPETEHLVEIALASQLPAGAEILDLGTGSGAIALAIAAERPDWRITAVDVSPATLAVARTNAEGLSLKNVQLLHSDWFDALPDSVAYALILSNPPYIAACDPHLNQGDVRFEPTSALVSGPDGLDDLRRIIDTAPRHLMPGGWLWLEHGCQQDESARALLQARGFEQIETHKDLAGLARHTGGQWPDANSRR